MQTTTDFVLDVEHAPRSLVEATFQQLVQLPYESIGIIWIFRNSLRSLSAKQPMSKAFYRLMSKIRFIELDGDNMTKGKYASTAVDSYLKGYYANTDDDNCVCRKRVTITNRATSFIGTPNNEVYCTVEQVETDLYTLMGVDPPVTAPASSSSETEMEVSQTVEAAAAASKVATAPTPARKRSRKEVQPQPAGVTVQ